MKNIFRGLLLAAVAGLAGCSTDFDITSDWKDITVVYGLLNHTDTAHYVKINRAYLSESTNALEQATLPDSVYYQDIDVRLEEIGASGVVTNTVQLSRVDGNLEGHPKPSGTFVNEPNWLYKTNYAIDPARRYRLTMTKADGNTSAAETNIVSDLIIVRPFLGQQVNMTPGTNANYVASWKTAKNASFYGLTIRFFYSEYPEANPTDSVVKSFDWVVFTDLIHENTVAGQTKEYYVNSNLLYEEIAKHVQPLSGYRRRASHLEFIYAAGGHELYTYYLVSRAQQGITSGQITPEYSNVAGGKGILSSRTFTSTFDQFGAPVPIRTTTIDSISCNKLTRDLRFVNSQGLLCP